jgi:hypothetical protein
MLCFLILVIGAFFFTLWRIKRGNYISVRKIPGVLAIEDAVGKAAELGRPTVFSTGLTGVGPVLYACLGILQSVATKVARYKTKLFVTQYDPEALPIVEETVRESYRQAGRPDAFREDTIAFLSSEQFAYASGYMGLVHRENAATCFLFGSFAAESLILAEAGQQVGATQVAASVSPEQTAFFICTCDYTLIGEELFAASAYLGTDPIQRSALRAQDLVKGLAFLTVVVGVIFSTLSALGMNSVGATLGAYWQGIEGSYLELWRRVL